MTGPEEFLEDQVLRVTLPIGQVPERATVTKIKGTKAYTVRDKLEIYTHPNHKGAPQIIEARGTRFLVSDDGSLISAAHDAEFEWHVSMLDLHHWLSRELEPTPQ